ncbi:hypothetical protein HMPREF9962_1965 [Streptococcus parasanguinis SK236]|nr:hypothetical protein HMPREF9962_1965 [Streptococcus parasanguinis SK236]
MEKTIVDWIITLSFGFLVYYFYKNRKKKKLLLIFLKKWSQ